MISDIERRDRNERYAASRHFTIDTQRSSMILDDIRNNPQQHITRHSNRNNISSRNQSSPNNQRINRHNEIDRQRNRSNSRGHLHNTLIGDVVKTQNQSHINNIHETQQIDVSFLDEPTFLPSQSQQPNRLPSIPMMSQTLLSSHFNQLPSLNNSFYN